MTQYCHDVFDLLEKCYWICKEDDLGALLGAMDCRLWSNREPADPAIYDNLMEMYSSTLSFKENVLAFLEMYQIRFGCELKETIALLTNDQSLINL